MENCIHQIKIDSVVHGGGTTQKNFLVAKCQNCHQIFSVILVDRIEDVLASFANDLIKLTNQLAKIEGHLYKIANKK